MAISVGGYLDNPRLAILLFAVGGVFSYGYLIKVIFNLCHIDIIDVLKRNLTKVGTAFLYVTPLVLMKMNGLGGLYLLLIAILTLTAYVFFHKKALVYLVEK